MRLLTTIFFISALLFISCKDDGLTDDPNSYSCEDLDAFLMRVRAESDKGNIIKPGSGLNSEFQLEYYDGLILKLELNEDRCALNQIYNDKDWFTALDFNFGEQSGPLKYRGTIGAVKEQNTSGYCPLMIDLALNTRYNAQVRTVVNGKHGRITDIAQNHGTVTDFDVLSVYGLYPDYNNVIEYQVLSEDGLLLFSDTLQVQTSALPFELPEIVVTEMDTAAMEPGMTLVSERIYSNPSRPFMIDAFGECRWFLELDNHPQLSDLNYDTGMERLANGNLYFGDKITDAIYEIDFSGQVINEIPLAPYEYHHDVYEKPDGNFLVTVTDLSSQHENGTYTIEDFIIEIDRDGQQLHVWDLKDYLDENRIAWDDNLNDLPIDWAHINSVVYDPSDNSIIISCRLQGVIKIGYDDEIKWILGPHRGWATNRRGEDLNNFLLEPLDAGGNPISDADLLDGAGGHPDFEWNWFQHAVDVLPNGDIILFDNGEKRFYTGEQRYSRGVQYRIQTEEKTVQQIWDYGKERGEFGFSRLVSDIDRLDNGNMLYAPGYRVDNMNGEGGKIIELDPEDNSVLWEVEIKGQGSLITFHRVERMRF